MRDFIILITYNNNDKKGSLKQLSKNKRAGVHELALNIPLLKIRITII
jgi:hypothetical protein